MSRLVHIGSGVVVAALVAAATTAAQARVTAPVPPAPRPQACPEGTFQGQCVNPLVARFARDAAIAFTQAQISVTERPYPASQDTTFSYPDNVAAFPPVATRQTLIGNGGAYGAYDRAQRGE